MGYPLKTLLYVIMMVTMVIYFYTNLGAIFFHDVKLDLPYSQYANFRTIPAAMELLFIQSTGEMWSYTLRMFVHMNPYPDGTALSTVYPFIAVAILVSFQLIVRYVQMVGLK